VPADVAIEATIRMARDCDTMGGARGNLLPLLEKELCNILDEDVHEILNDREGVVGLAYRELFPRNNPVLDTSFLSKDHVVDSVCNSCMFPFFSSNWPCRLSKAYDGKQKTDNGISLPRIVVDGFFAVPRERFGCPDFNMVSTTTAEPQDEEFNINNTNEADGSIVDRTVTISVFPHTLISLTASDEHDRISPLQPQNQEDLSKQIGRLFQLATQTAPKEEYYQLYEEGWSDVERWIKQEEERRGI